MHYLLSIQRNRAAIERKWLAGIVRAESKRSILPGLSPVQKDVALSQVEVLNINVKILQDGKETQVY